VKQPAGTPPTGTAKARIFYRDIGDYSDFILRQARERPDKILYNETITVGPVPAEAYDYVVNGKSAIEWVMERYAVTTHKESGIVNDPNLWCDEHDDPAYIVNLLRRVIDLSRKSVEIIKKLPKLKF